MTTAKPPGSGGGGVRRRRPRYPGTHPRRFEERYKERQPDRYPGITDHIRAQGRTPAGSHVPILVDEVLDVLAPAPGEIVADCTLGHGGHALEFLKRIGPGGMLVGFDLDGGEMERAGRRLEKALGEAGMPGPAGPQPPKDGAGAARSPGATIRPRLELRHSHFAGLARALPDLGIDGYDVVFADLGVSSMQLDDPARGFSYKHDGPLDMRMDSRRPRTAADLLKTLSADELETALHELGNEPDAGAVAARIVRARQGAPLETTAALTDLVLAAKGLTREEWRQAAAKSGRALHPAARTFQALRILVNDELGGLAELLRLLPWCLRQGGRVGIISFHSGEDRLVKQAFRAGLADGTYEAAAEDPIRPGPEERRDNPRSSPARLRWARRPAG